MDNQQDQQGEMEEYQEGDLEKFFGCCPQMLHPDEPDPSVKAEAVEVPLTRGMVALISPGDAEEIARYRWQAKYDRKSNKWYAAHKTSTKNTELMHRLILKAPDGIQVDHEDNDGLNNTRGNIRLATQSQNLANRRPLRGCQYKGIALKPSGRFIAAIQKDGRREHIGTYDTPEEAARAYDQKAVEVHGEFAYLNFPEERSSHGR